MATLQEMVAAALAGTDTSVPAPVVTAAEGSSLKTKSASGAIA